MAKFRGNEVVKVNRGWLESMAETLLFVAKSIESGKSAAWENAPPNYEAIKNISNALKNAANKGKE